MNQTISDGSILINYLHDGFTNPYQYFMHEMSPSVVLADLFFQKNLLMLKIVHLKMITQMMPVCNFFNLIDQENFNQE